MLHSVNTLQNRALKLFLRPCDYKIIRQAIHSVGLNDIPKVTGTDIKKIIRQKGLAVQDGYTSFITKCTICAGNEKSSDSKLYINKTTGTL